MNLREPANPRDGSRRGGRRAARAKRPRPADGDRSASYPREGGGVGNAQELFDELNRSAFAGRLLRHRVRFRSRFAYDCDLLGQLNVRSRVIVLRRGLSDSTAETVRQVLLHEMCHIVALGHDAVWRAELLRAAALAGESEWARGEAEEYAGKEVGEDASTCHEGSGPDTGDFFDDEIILPMLEEMSYDPDATLGTALATVSREARVPVGTLLKAFPWMPAAWRRLRRRLAYDGLPADFFPEHFDREAR